MSLFYFISLLLLFLFPHLSSACTSPAVHSAATLYLSATAAPPPPQVINPWKRLSYLASVSAARVHHLKHHNPGKASSAAFRSPLFPHSYGGYTVNLSFGTPPQNLSFLLDTGSSLVWFPCTRRYACASCNLRFVGPTNTSAVFLPELSSSAERLGCRNRKCEWFFPNFQCPDCGRNSTDCDRRSCPPFQLRYGSGSTIGFLLSETLNLPGQSPVDDFVVGCSVFSTGNPSGIVGFGRGLESLPSQIGVKRFSYCMISHQFDDAPASGDLVLSGDGGSAAKINYIPFRKISRATNPSYEQFYYVTLRKIKVGGVDVRVPYEYLAPDSAGNGGTIVDSGTTFTFMENPVFEMVTREFERQAGENYSRATEAESMSGIRPCFEVSSGGSTVVLPLLSFHFKGGARLVLPVENYFSFVKESVVCMTVNTDNGGGGKADSGGRGTFGPGPAIIFGNYQQQNIYMEYDLENGRLGFRKQICR